MHRRTALMMQSCQMALFSCFVPCLTWGGGGTTQYLTDWVRSRWWLKNRFGEQCLVVPLVLVPVQGIRGGGPIRSLLDSLSWFTSLNDTEAILLRGAMATFIGTFMCQGTGYSNLNGWQCFRVPASLDTKASVSLVSEGWGFSPGGIQALSEAAERGLSSP